MNDDRYKIMSWNVRGLNNPARRLVVREVARAHKIAILNLQETKIQTWSTELATDIGGSNLQGCVVLPAIGTRGGAAIFWDKQRVNIVSHHLGRFSIMVRVEIASSNNFFWMTTVYGPKEEDQKQAFLDELAGAAPPLSEPWMLNGDFNMIYEARDKNNSNINRRLMGRFRKAIDTAGLKEIKCKNRRFTWSSERDNPTLCSIDKVFCNSAWETLHPGFMLTTASTSLSDHCPLVLANADAPIRQARFRFENFWPRFPHFFDIVQHAWDRPVNHDCPYIRIKRKMQRVAKDLKIWSRTLFGGVRQQFHIANEVILRLDVAQESRRLSAEELKLRKDLKAKVVGLAAIDRVRKRQSSRITWLRAGDANTKIFHAKICSRRRKNSFIPLGWGTLR